MGSVRAQAMRTHEHSSDPLVPRSRVCDAESVAAAKRYAQYDDRRGFNSWRRKAVLMAVFGIAFGVGVPAVAIGLDAVRLPTTSTTTP